MNPHKNLVHKQMTFKYYQHCKIWLGLIYLLTFILSAWWNTCKYLHFNMSFCACESRQFDSNDLSHKSLNKWWTSNKSMTWTLLDAYWRRQVNMACGSPSKRSGSVLDSSAGGGPQTCLSPPYLPKGLEVSAPVLSAYVRAPEKCLLQKGLQFFQRFLILLLCSEPGRRAWCVLQRRQKHGCVPPLPSGALQSSLCLNWIEW